MSSPALRRLRIALVLLPTFLIGCAGGREIPGKTVDHRYVNVAFTPTTVTHTTAEGVEIAVAPIDAAQLNNQTYAAATRDGGYEQEYVNVLQYAQGEIDRMSRPDRMRAEARIDATEMLRRAIGEGRATDPELLQLLLHRLWNGEGVGRDGSEIDYLKENAGPPTYNPFKIEGGYLSVFEVELRNASDSIQTVRIDEFQVSNGNEILYPLGMDYFEGIIPPASVLRTNLLRMNMPGTISVPPGASVVKYISTPALSVAEGAVDVYYVKDGTATPFSFGVEEHVASDSYQLTGYRASMPLSSRDGTTVDRVYAVRIHGAGVFPLEKDVFYVGERGSSVVVDVCSLAVRLRSRHRVGCAFDVALSAIPDRLIKLEGLSIEDL